MYVLLIALGVGGGIWAVATGFGEGRRRRVIAGVAAVLVTAAVFLTMTFWVEMLWFDALGQSVRFWRFMGAQVGAVVVGATVAALAAAVLTRGAPPLVALLARWGAALAGVAWGLLAWQRLLLFLGGEQTGAAEPMLGLDIGFYLFVLPLLDSLFWLALVVAVIALAANLVVHQGAAGFEPGPAPEQTPRLVPGASMTFALVLAFGTLLRVAHLLYSELGVVMGPGWTDIHIRLPALLLMAVVLVIAAMLPLISRFRSLMSRLAARVVPGRHPTMVAVLGAWSVVGVAWFVLVVSLPLLVQWLVVKPNEITFEAPYIARNIEFTRRAFRLDGIEERQFPATAELTEASRRNNAHLLHEIRLWDWRALDAVYRQFQEIRLYYEFVDVDIDRYQIGDRYRQVMVSARELEPGNLPAQSQTFINQRMKYTHGYGYTLAPVSDFTSDGLPNLLVKDIPPVAAFAELALTRPEIYYGELTRQPVVVNTREPEFDYPSGESNVYARYQGEGGVALSSLWRRLAFGWHLDGTVFVLSSYPTAQSRVLYHRRVQDRLRRLAPFLTFDEDPYIVAAGGRLYWVVDAYTTSSHYPYAQAYDALEVIALRDGTNAEVTQYNVRGLHGRNYVRNPVKAVIDAYDGSVDLYVFDEDDPIVRAWRRVLPDMFKKRRDMPDALRAHVRYPQDFMLVQGLMFASYHMTDPEVFYNQEDLWVRATEKHYDNITPVEPYYVMWELPGSDRAEFVLILPFTPKHRQVLIGWIAALSDGDNYGRFLAYKFPKERRVLGPQQVETKIDQDAFLSGQLTLWDQQGSEVIRGNVLAIPIDDSLLYVEPIYLRAETAAYPELRLVAVMHGDRLSYAETFDEALAGLFVTATSDDESIADLVRRAGAAFEAYLEALGNQQFEATGQQLERLSRALTALENQIRSSD